ncbi:MAG: DNA-processing protein DprA [Dysgonamonadaceae bacterium]|jgi:DNA processing protein|nr:DNA-processing protein DprA [Dysgonamonadaceae bacterium]
MYNQNLIYQIGLTLVKGIGNITAKQIIEHLGDPESLFKEKARILEQISGINRRVIAEIRNPAVLKRAEKEVLFIEKNGIKVLYIKNENYPVRFRECIDSPVIMYFHGNADLNANKIISIVGTRNASAYGRETTERIVKELSEEYKNILIVSGLAYGIDYSAHQAALKNGLPTVGVLAHGLDLIYPHQHRKLAIEMLEKGGLLTDFLSETNPDRQNFVKRNRIVAGISDCTLVVESAGKGGALITANIADAYNKDLFAIPGKVNDIYSQGCNKLIKEKKAALVENAEDIMREMCWKTSYQKKSNEVIQRKLPIDLPPEQQQIINLLAKSESIHLNILSIELNLPVSKLSSLLFDMELDGMVKAIPGGLYRLI